MILLVPVYKKGLHLEKGHLKQAEDFFIIICSSSRRYKKKKKKKKSS